jgi:hypothetical protein
VQRAVLWKLACPEDEGRFALIPRTTRERHRLVTLPRRVSREGKVRSRDIASRSAVHQFAMQNERLRLLPRPPEDSGQADDGKRMSPGHLRGGFKRGDGLVESSSQSQRYAKRPARHKRLRV